MRDLSLYTYLFFKETDGGSILVKDSKVSNYMTYKYVNKSGRNILLVVIEGEACYVFDGEGHLIDNNTLVEVETRDGKFMGIAKVSKCDLRLQCDGEKRSLMYSKIHSVRAIKYMYENYIEDVDNTTRKYYY